MATIGIDIGGTKIAIGVLSGTELVAVEHHPFRYFGNGAALAAFLRGRIQALGASFAVSAVGIGAPGWVRQGVVFEAVNLGFDKLPLLELLRAPGGLPPVAVENDARTALLGEWFGGALAGCRNAMMVTVGTGIGGALLLNGAPYLGGNRLAGEIGHLSVDESGPPCPCGKRGCLELYASGAGIERAARQRAASSAALTRAAEGGLQNIRSEHVFEAAKAGDATCQRIVEGAVRALAYALFETAYLLDLDRIAIGGGLAAQGELLVEPLRARSHRPGLRLDVVTARLGNLAGVIGAARLEA